MSDIKQEERIPFDYEKYLSGDYKAVYRNDDSTITRIEEISEERHAVYDDDIMGEIMPWLILPNGRLRPVGEDDNDVFLVLEEKASGE